MVLNLGTTLKNVASRVVVLKFQEELEKRRQQVAATPQPTPAPRPVPVPGVPEATLQARARMPQLGVPNPLDLLNRIAPKRPYSATPSLDLANTPFGRTMTQPYLNAPVRPQYGLTGGPQMLAQAAQQTQAKGLAPYQAMTQTMLPESVTSTPYIGRPLGLAATPAIWPFGLEAGAQMVGGRAALGAVGRLGWGEKGEEILGTVGEVLGLGTPALYRGGKRLAGAMTPAIEAKVAELYPTVREAVGSEAGGLKLSQLPGAERRAADAAAKAALKEETALWRTKFEAELPAATGPQKAGIKKASQAAARAEGDETYKSGIGKLVYSLKNWKGTRADFELAKHEELSRRAGKIAETWANPDITPAEAHRLTRQIETGGLTEGFEGARLEAITAKEEAALNNVIKEHPDLTPFDRDNVYSALEYFMYGKGNLEPAQAGLLARTFGTDVGRAILDNRSWGAKITDEIMTIWRLPQMLMSAGEWSATLRQGGLFISHPQTMLKALRQEFIAMKSEAAAELRSAEWMQNPIVKEYNAERAFTPVGKAAVMAMPGAREEQYIVRLSKEERSFIARLINRIPGVSHVYKGSERAYVGFLNEAFGSELVARAEQWKRAGVEVTPELKKALVDWLSLMRGRGKLGPLEKYVSELTIPLWSPRLWAARLETVPYALVYGIKQPAMRKMIAQDMAGFVAANASLLALLKYSGLADVELDPRSTDWGKIKIGPMRLDPWGGFQQLARTIVQVGTGTKKASGTGDLYTISRMETAWRYALSKLSPAAQDVARLGGAQMPVDETTLTPAGILKKIGSRTIPLWWQDIKSAWDAEGALGVGIALPGALGWGVMTYETPYDKKRTIQNEIAKDSGYKNFDDMAEAVGTPRANEITDADPRILALQPEIERYRKLHGGERTMADVRAPFVAEQAEEDAKLDADPSYHTTWLANLKEREKLLAASFTEFLNANPDRADQFEKEAAKIKDPFALPADATPDTVRSAYYKLFTPYKGETGLISADEWDKLGPEIDRFRANLTVEQQLSLDENLGAGRSEDVKKYRDDQKKMQPYFDLTETEWQAFTKKIPPARRYAGMTYDQYYMQVVQGLKAKGKNETWTTNDPILSLFEDYSSPKRSVYLVRNPEVDALRVLWYGTLAHSPKAAKIYKEWTGLTVRIAE